MRKTFTIAEFMAGKHNETWLDRAKEKMTKERIEKWMKTVTGLTVPITTGLFTGSHVFAAPAVAAMSVPGTQTLILKAFDPLIQLIVALSYPIAGVMIAGGCLLVMVQQREQGFRMLQNAALGYILVQLSPLLLKILVGVTTGVPM